MKVTFLLVVAAGVALGQDANAPLRARDLFFSAEGLVKQSHRQGPKPRRPAGQANAVPKNVPADVANAEQEFALVSLAETPLGLRYTLLKQTPTGSFVEVPMSSEFHTGDRIRLGVMANHDGYLRVMTRSGERWERQFPAPDSGSADFRVKAGRYYQIPGGQDESLQFDGEPSGRERAVIILSKLPIVSNASDADKLLADARSRDLVFTRSDEESGKTKEAAVYAVDPHAGSDPSSRVVIELTLEHR